MTTDERTPLLPPTSNDSVQDRHIAQQLPGPLDLPRSTRYGILLGVWIANFLSVRTSLGLS